MEFNNNQAIYLQIAEMICERVLLNIFKEDERIPSVREMAVQLEVNPNTVMRTFEFLQGKNIITNKRGVGYFVSPGGKEKAASFRREEFLQNELPQLFKTAELLNIPFEELKDLYTAQKNQKGNS
ncbi:MAG: GntR family transcriptional regulator [Bacteroidota bacterium]